jgi:hypothetical protein
MREHTTTTSSQDQARPAVLRRPQSGTPRWFEEGVGSGSILLVDQKLIELGLQSRGHRALCKLLLDAQASCFGSTGHIISYADEYIMRRIRRGGGDSKVPNVYARCMRCGCLALLLDWCAAASLALGYVDFGHLYPDGARHPVDNSFWHPCNGSRIAADGMLLLD